MSVAPTVLDAARRQLLTKWRSMVGVVGVSAGATPTGAPALFMHGPAIMPPPGLPGVMVVPDTAGRPYRVPIFWQITAAHAPQPVVTPKPELFDTRHGASRPLDPLNDEDIDRAYWSFFTPTTPREVHSFSPAFHVPQVPVLGPPPPADDIAGQAALAIRLPQYNLPNFWAKPFEPVTCPCMLVYATPQLAYTYTVPEMSLIIVDGISFSLPNCMVNEEIIQIDIYRSGIQVASFEEMMADNLNPDPGNRAAFSSHVRPLPLWLRFDRNETISIFITPRGLFPFPKTPADSFCGNICVLLHGWIASLIDNRDGAMRPIDVGRMREGTGDELASAVSADDMTLLVQWLTDVGATQGA